jgi:hypothetical protein
LKHNNGIKKHLDKAYPMFNSWVTKAKVMFPKFSFQINEVANLRSDLEDTLKNAVLSLRNEGRAKKRIAQGFDYGYFCGFIQGNLNAVWYNEYIYKQTNNYKVYAALSTLDGFLKTDKLLSTRLSSLYSEYYKSQINIENADQKIVIDLPKSIDFIDIENAHSQILVALENVKIDIIKKMYDKKIPDFLTRIEESFSEEEVHELLELN